VLGFLVSSKLDYLRHPDYKTEVVRIPQNATTMFAVDSVIQCFSLECLSVSALCEGFESGVIQNKGRLLAKYLHKTRDAVRQSRFLTQIEIEKALRLLPPASS
jgi:hypothetical protein